MASDVHIEISWEGNSIEKTVPIAQAFLDEKRTEEDELTDETKWFLKDVINGKSCFKGSKGDLWLWGIIGNYTRGETLLEELKPFFKTLYEKRYILNAAKVIVMEENEQTENVTIFQLGRDGQIKTFTSEGKWFWGQY